MKNKIEYMQSSTHGNAWENIEQISFNITTRCNYNCEYCKAAIKRANGRQTRDSSDEVVDAVLKVLPKIKPKSAVAAYRRRTDSPPKTF
jgi:sulfatase maturation enzyme AslB (radical SAM superfamily)